MQKEYFGNGSIKRLRSIFEEVSPKKVLIVSGNKSYELSGAKTHIEEALNGIEWERYYGFEENPKFPELLNGAKVVKDFAPDLIIAVGGGSVIDTAKVISILPNEAHQAKSVIKGESKQKTKIAPIIAIPTTSGSGSEATHFAVAYIDDVKYSLASEQLLPEHVIIDPELTYSMSPYQTAISGLDAFCQAVESYWSINSSEESLAYAKEALELILINLSIAVNEEAKPARKEMIKASNLAGKAINITKTTAPHALSYTLTSKYHIPHGQAVALFLPVFLKFNAGIDERDCNDLRGYVFVKDRISDLQNIIGGETIEETVALLDKFITSLGINTKLGEYNIGQNQVKQIVDNVNFERMKNNPRKLTSFSLTAIVKSII